MRYYAHYGHTEFILCLGYGGHAVKDYFLNYRETGSNDFVLTKGGEHIHMLSSDISNWSITFIDTGLHTAIGERLRRVRPYLEGDEVFLANYGDVLTDAPIDEMIENFLETDATGSLLAVKPQDSFHVVDLVEDNKITGLTAVADMSMRINGGYFVLRQAIFDYLDEGDDLVMDGCVRAARDNKLYAVPYDGFWAPMDTLKERAALEEQYHNGIRPWALWLDRPVDRSPVPGAGGPVQVDLGVPSSRDEAV
jgi:glucose-1-phosphate cytidylyltransferase